MLKPSESKVFPLIFLTIVIVLSMFAFSACSANNSNNKAKDGQNTKDSDLSDANGNVSSEIEGKEARYYPSPVEGLKTVYNERFDFWFDLPEQWKAVDRSDNGDGYFVISENPGVDIRVYGVMKTISDDEYVGSLSGTDGTVEKIDFDDGKTGSIVTIEGIKTYVVRADVDTYINFYINYQADTSWYDANEEKLMAIALSLRTKKEVSGPSLGDGKIKLGDLSLGNIKIDMIYEKVKSLMKSKLLKEQNDEYQGITLFYEDGTEIYVIDNSVAQMNVNSPSYTTPRGLKVGDMAEDATRLYGEPDVKEQDHFGYNLDGYELLTLILKDGKIAQIQISVPQ